jgi:hypothetical protein
MDAKGKKLLPAMWKNAQLDEREHAIMYGLVRFDL